MKKALLVGINKYKHGGNDLNGCVNDVVNIRNILMTYYGYNTEDIRVLTDERATKAGTIERLKWLVNGTSRGDRIVFHNSSHGSQIRDRYGDELSDGMDEILCPYDMDWDGTFITDDDLKEIFNELPDGVVLDVILDCCHSGTGTREIHAFYPKQNDVDNNNVIKMKNRYLQPPIDILLRDDRSLNIKKILKGCFKNRGEDTIATMNHSLIAGCMDNQTSADAYIGNAYNGALTYFLCKAIREHNGRISRKNLINVVRNMVRINNFEQIPQLECCEKMSNEEFLLF